MRQHLYQSPSRWHRCAPKKGEQAIGIRRGGRTTKIHAIVADVDLPIVHPLSPGSASDDPEGQKLMPKVPKKIRKGKPLIMDKAYEGDQCRKKARSCGMRPVVPPKSHRLKPWRYDKELSKQRYIVECHFRNIKQYRRVFTRYDKLDETDNAFIVIAQVCRLLRN